MRASTTWPTCQPDSSEPGAGTDLAATLILQFFPRHLLLDSYELAISGYPETRSLHMAILEGIEKLTFGDALFEAAARAKGVPAMPVIDPERHPNLAKSIAANTLDDEEVFTEALRIFFAGVRVRVAVVLV